MYAREHLYIYYIYAGLAGGKRERGNIKGLGMKQSDLEWEKEWLGMRMNGLE